MNLKNLLLGSLLSSFSLVACVAEPLDGDDLADGAADDVELVGEGAEAIIGPGGEDGGGSITRNVTLSCSITSPSLFNEAASIKNTSAHAIPDHAKISYTVTHYYNSPTPFYGSTTGPLAKGATKSISLSHPGYLHAYGCSAKASWIVD
ncbi:hypothetical protein BE08_35525 [Sorangium cellulosum]|uniref:Secreted protein n=1 Tax=Sorangium cellulosum TaxID=56 RepID=A0A150PLT2_SORCE|nr:hypothetical protein BE08_35525 [Sorangium cellulosum]